jgi:hypothetical protein
MQAKSASIACHLISPSEYIVLSASAAVKGALKTSNAQKTALEERLGRQQTKLQDKVQKLKELSLDQVMPHCTSHPRVTAECM